MGVAHVRGVVSEVESHWKRLQQLAESRRLQLDQLKQLFSCEKDAEQVTASSLVLASVSQGNSHDHMFCYAMFCGYWSYRPLLQLTFCVAV